MPSAAFKLTWRGRDVEDAVNRATIAGMTETLEACVTQAKINAPVLTGALREDIQAEKPQERAKRITARWGNKLIHYSIFQELGTVFIRAKHYLQRAADQEYPKLAGRIKKYYDANS